MIAVKKADGQQPTILIDNADHYDVVGPYIIFRSGWFGRDVGRMWVQHVLEVRVIEDKVAEKVRDGQLAIKL